MYTKIEYDKEELQIFINEMDNVTVTLVYYYFITSKQKQNNMYSTLNICSQILEKTWTI